MNSKPSWVLNIDPAVFKTVQQFPRSDRERILFALEILPQNPFAGDIQKMRGERNAWRRRIGSFRIFFELSFSDKVIFVYRVERRSSKTY